MNNYQVSNLERITFNPRIMAGQACIRGMRVPVSLIINLVANGKTTEEIIEDYPSEVLPDLTLNAQSYAVILSHDPKIDDNALSVLLDSDVAYIGALGSRKTHQKRIARLEKAGYTESQINRIQAPIGLNISAKTPKEIALSIMAEIIGVKNKHK